MKFTSLFSRRVKVSSIYQRYKKTYLSFRAKRRRVVEDLPEKSRKHLLYAHEILRRYAPLDDRWIYKKDRREKVRKLTTVEWGTI